MSAIDHNETSLDFETIRKYDITGPRYTSYPTALEFQEGFAANDYQLAAQEGNGALLPDDMSLYFHLPFCRQLCFYCGCNKLITNNKDTPNKYLDYLLKEIRMHGESTDWDRKVRQLHLGGGTPTYYSADQIEQLMNQVRRYFSLISDENRDYSIKIDPRTVGYKYLLHLLRLGFNRISVGVQDMDPQVQEAVNRIQTEATTRDLILQARSLGFRSINVDLIYGLPLQSRLSFSATLNSIIGCAPDRISIHSFAHLPEKFDEQKNINKLDLPGPDERIELYLLAVEILHKSGYVHLGMDHFVKPDDRLTIAQSHQTLHRNFQGYTAYKDCDVLGIGLSATGSFEKFYYQNTQDLETYFRLIDDHRLPVVKGVYLSLDDHIRKAIIMQIMCEGKVNKTQLQQYFGIDFDDYFDSETRALDQLASDKLIEIDTKLISITPAGKYFLRNIALIFDAYRNVRPKQQTYSEIG